MSVEVSSSVRRWRAKRGLSQAQLGEAIGLSRQSLSAIESGRQVPSTAVALLLAAELGCSVEELFSVATGRTIDAVGRVPPGTRVVVGQVDGRWVMHRVGSDAAPADGIARGSTDGERRLVECLSPVRLLEQQVLVAGCAPLIGILAGRAGRGRRELGAGWIRANSSRALELLASGRVHIAGLHLAEPADDHAELVAKTFPRRAMTIVHLTRWQQGLIVPRGNPRGISTDDLTRPDLRWAVREPGAGARRMFDRYVDGAQEVVGAQSHTDVADLVRFDIVDAGVAIESVARAGSHGFLPLAEERFDLVVPSERLDIDAVSALLDEIGSRGFRTEAESVRGYDVSRSGDVTSVRGAE